MKGLFATPVDAIEMPGAAALNAELGRTILRRREQTRSVQASNSGGTGLRISIAFNLGVATTSDA